MTPDERKVNEREKGVKGGLQVRTLYFLFAEFSQLLIFWKADLEMEGKPTDWVRHFCLPRLLTAKHKVLHERVIHRQRVQLNPAILGPGTWILLILHEKLNFAWSKVLNT